MLQVKAVWQQKHNEEKPVDTYELSHRLLSIIQWWIEVVLNCLCHRKLFLIRHRAEGGQAGSSSCHVSLRAAGWGHIKRSLLLCLCPRTGSSATSPSWGALTGQRKAAGQGQCRLSPSSPAGWASPAATAPGEVCSCSASSVSLINALRWI